MTFEGAVVTSGFSRHTADGEDHPSNRLNPLTSEPARLGGRGWWEADPEWRSDRRLERVHHTPSPCKEHRHLRQQCHLCHPVESCGKEGGLWLPAKLQAWGNFSLSPGLPHRLAGEIT